MSIMETKKLIALSSLGLTIIGHTISPLLPEKFNKKETEIPSHQPETYEIDQTPSAKVLLGMSKQVKSSVASLQWFDQPNDKS